jgi:DNA polymerase
MDGGLAKRLPLQEPGEPGMAKQDKRLSALQILELHRLAGVDEAIASDPFDRFEATEKKPPSKPASPRQTVPQAVSRPRPAPNIKQADTLDTDAQALAARDQAAACGSLDELRDCLAGFDGLRLKQTAKNLVFGDGDPKARVMLIGEAPGREEDIKGLPFVGRSGQLLDKMLAAIGLDRTAAYITNIVPFRPPGNRSPTPAETAICRPFMDRHVELVNPEILVFLGGVAAKEMLGVTTGIMRLRGQWRRWPGESGKYRAIATLHPAYLLRQPAQKKLAWADLREIARALKAGPAD